ncbi:unnamed protein product [Sphagnum jensenii]|uniref:Thioredoxin domain-containing protein n=1 Tax=Sphagnum jensenii TaxID=128206 RepID=A0ABP0WZY0_9BRYO
MNSSTTTTTAIPSAQALLDPADMKLSSSKTVPPPLLPLPPARQAAERKRIAAEAVIKNSSSVVTAANVQVGTKVVVAVEKEFDEVVLESKVPVLVDFWASWCGPCKLVAPSMDKIDQKYSGQVKVVKVETTENSELVEKYKVYGLPTLILFIDGKEVPGSRHEGAISFAKVESLLMSFLPTLVPS